MSTIPVSAAPPNARSLPPPSTNSEHDSSRTFVLPPIAPPPVASPLFDEPLGEKSNSERERIGSRILTKLSALSWLISAVVHCLALIVVALLAPVILHPRNIAVQLSAPESWQRAQVETLNVQRVEIKTAAEDLFSADQLGGGGDLGGQIGEPLTQVATTALDSSPGPLRVDLSGFGEQTAPKGDLLTSLGGGGAGMALSGRGAAEQGKMVATYGGTASSQEAVAISLKWLAEHQNADGSWNFDHRTAGTCRGQCGDPGVFIQCKTGATAIALLPFLGAGQTQLEGDYKEVVRKGLYYLTSQMKVKTQRGKKVGDFSQGLTLDRGYSHALSAIVLCEDYAMTGDRELMQPAQWSLNYIAYAQDPVGGGWRYTPHQPGDTSVLGWQLMALKSGHMAYLSVDGKTIQGATRFLDSVQFNSGENYGYTSPSISPSTTAIGLLCRMYLGWKKNEPALQRGVAYLAALGPSKNDIYFDYYATQVIRHYHGEPDSEGHDVWMHWNHEMRDSLVSSQEKEGHLKGSWMFRDDRHSIAGGRLYCTAMATLILEVYYRHLPLYSHQAATDEFPL